MIYNNSIFFNFKALPENDCCIVGFQ